MDKKTFRQKLGRSIQLERRGSDWLAHLDKETLQKDFNVSLNAHLTSKEKAIYVFNYISEQRGVEPLRDPAGYMALDNNLQTYIKQTYENRYEETLEDIEDNIIDGTGYGVESVLNKLDSTIRNDIKQHLPKDMNYGDLRFVAVNDERKQAVDAFVNARISKTLAYEKKRSYEPEAMERIDTRFKEAGQAFQESLGDGNEKSLTL